MTDETGGAFMCSTCWRNMPYSLKEAADGVAFESALGRHDCKTEAARAERQSKFEAVIDAMADREATQVDVARAVTEYGSACFAHAKACPR